MVRRKRIEEAEQHASSSTRDPSLSSSILMQPAAESLTARWRDVEGMVVPTGMGGKEAGKTYDAKKVLQQIKDAGLAGIVSYGLVQLAFFGVSVPVCLFGYFEATGHWPDLSNAEDQAQLAGESFAFLGFSRLLIPLRIGLALASTQWVQANLIAKFQKAPITSDAPSAAPSVAIPDADGFTTSKCVYCASSGQITCGRCYSSGTLSH
eukprot:3816979-Prymnesium_polylepis.1